MKLLDSKRINFCKVLNCLAGNSFFWSYHVTDTCMELWGVNNCNLYFLAKCRLIVLNSQKQKNQPKEEVSDRMSARTSGQKLRSALQIPEKKSKHFGTDMPRGRPRENFSPKNFWLNFHSLNEYCISEKQRWVENSGQGKYTINTPPPRNGFAPAPPPPMIRFPPSVCSHPVIFLRGNVHRPD